MTHEHVCSCVQDCLDRQTSELRYYMPVLSWKKHISLQKARHLCPRWPLSLPTHLCLYQTKKKKTSSLHWDNALLLGYRWIVSIKPWLAQALGWSRRWRGRPAPAESADWGSVVKWVFTLSIVLLSLVFNTHPHMTAETFPCYQAVLLVLESFLLWSGEMCSTIFYHHIDFSLYLTK